MALSFNDELLITFSWLTSTTTIQAHVIPEKNGYLDASEDHYDTVENIVSLNNFVQTYLTFFVSQIIYLN